MLLTLLLPIRVPLLVGVFVRSSGAELRQIRFYRWLVPLIVLPVLRTKFVQVMAYPIHPSA
jgi:hypothetical protein